MAAGEVAQLAVHIFPEMKGFRSKIMGESKAAGQSGGSLLARLFGDSGKNAGEKAGRSLRQAFSSASKGMTIPGLDKMNEQIKKVGRSVTSEHLRMLDAQDKVKVSQSKLNDAVSKYGKDSSQAVAAQARLDSAQRKADEASKRYKEDLASLKAMQNDRNELEKAYAPASYRQAISDIKTYGKAVKETLAESNKADKAQAEAQKRLEDAVTKYGVGSREAAKAAKELAAAQAQTGKAEGSYTEAVRKLTEAQKQASKAAKEYKPPELNGFQKAIENVRSGLSRLDGTRLSGLSGAFKKAGAAGEGLKAKISAGTVALGTAIGNAVNGALSSVKGFAQDCMSEYNEASEGIAKFNQIAANNHWSESQKQSLDELGESLKNVGVIDDDVTRAGQAQLGTFKLSAEAVKTLTPAMDDMVAHTKGLNASSQDAVTIGNLMGKVMTGSTSALQRYGVTMDANQKKLLEHGSAEQRAAALAKILEQNYGGVNKALAQTPAGKMKQLQNNVDDLKKSLGQSFTSVVGEIAPLFTRALNEARKPIENFAGWFKNAVKGISGSLQTGQINGAMKKAFGVNAGDVLQGLKGIKDGFKTAFAAISGQAGKAGKSLDGAKSHVSPLAAAFKALGGVVSAAGHVIAAIAPHFKAIAIGVASAVAAFKIFHTTVTIVTAATKLFGLTLSIGSGPIGLIVTAIAAAVAAFVGLEAKFHFVEKAADGIKKAWNGFTAWWGKLWNGVGKNIQGAAKGIQKHFDDAKKNVQKGWDTMKGWAQKTSSNIAKGFNGFKKDVGKHFDDAKKGAQKSWDGMKGWASRTGRNIAVGFKVISVDVAKHFRTAEKGARNAWKATPAWFRSSVAGRTISGFASMPGRIVGFFRNPAHSARSIWNGVTGFFGGLPGRIAGFFGSIPGRITGFFRSAGNGVKGAWNGVVGWFGGLPGRIVRFFQRLPQDMLNIGRNMIEGIINGIKNNIGRVAQVITGGMKSAIDNVKHFLGIHSPSTVMRDQVGQYVGLGLAEGIKTSMPAVTSAMDDMAAIPAKTRMSMPDMDALSRTSHGMGVMMTHEDAVAIVRAVEDLHRDLGPTISRWTPTMSGRERARVVRDALAGRY